MTAAYGLLSVGSSALGALVGGALVAMGGITAPMWFGDVLVASVFALAAPALRKDEVTLETAAVGVAAGDAELRDPAEKVN